MKQDFEEPSIKHAKKFKQAQDNVKSLVGTEWLDKFVESTEECIDDSDTNAQAELKQNSNETFMAFKKQ